MNKKTLLLKGLPYCSELAHQNIKDLYAILKWNLENHILVFRISSDLFPWMSEYNIQDLPNFRIIQKGMKEIGSFVLSNNMRISMHPGPFNVLCSPNKTVVNKTIKELNQHSEILNLLDFPCSHLYPVNIHVGASYGHKELASISFCNNFNILNSDTKSRLIVENDDKSSQYSVQELYEMLYNKIGIPITFDFHHHRFNNYGLTEKDALALAVKTWDTKPLTHYSSCKKTNEDKTALSRSHADYIYEKINSHGFDIDIELESKAKDLAVFRYRNDYKSLLDKYISFG